MLSATKEFRSSCMEIIRSFSGFPIAGATFTQDGFLLQKIAASNVGTLGLVLVLLIRLYSGWGYAGSRLQSKVIEFEGTYEETLIPHLPEETTVHIAHICRLHF
jgi:hypothetical protein